MGGEVVTGDMVDGAMVVGAVVTGDMVAVVGAPEGLVDVGVLQNSLRKTKQRKASMFLKMKETRPMVEEMHSVRYFEDSFSRENTSSKL